jgi:uncharacterized SAM-binding protein YcdF (DUF218 family)
MKMEQIKLTPKQNAVVWCLQNGWVLITGSEMKGATVCNKTHEYHINNGLFWRLVILGIIHQTGGETNFDFRLTKIGANIKTKPVTF